MRGIFAVFALFIFVPFVAARAQQGPLVVAEDIRIAGSSLAPARLRDVARPFLGRPLDRAGLQRVTDAVSALYEKSDIGLYAVTVPAQNFAGGRLQIAVEEGFFAHIDLKGAPGAAFALARSYAARLAGERPLRRSTFQRCVALLRAIPGAAVTLSMTPDKGPGAVRLAVTVAPRDRVLAFGIDNRGDPLFGRTRLQGVAEWYGLFGAGSTRLSAVTAIPFGRVESVAVTQSSPVGDDGTVLAMGAAYQRTDRLRFSAQSVSLQLSLALAVLRQSNRALDAWAGVDSYDLSGRLGRTPFRGSHVRALRLGASYIAGDGAQTLLLAATAGIGHSAAGGFAKLTLRAGFDRPIGDTVMLHLRGTGQYAAGPLPVSELASFGGGDIGAAFAPAAAFGDRAVGGRAEINWQPPPGRVVPYVFVDGGTAVFAARHPFAAHAFDLASAGAGVRLALGPRIALMLEGATALAADVAQPHPATWRFSFALTANTD
jgi:hemolysin activation/secretion protein